MRRTLRDYLNNPGSSQDSLGNALGNYAITRTGQKQTIPASQQQTARSNANLARRDENETLRSVPLLDVNFNGADFYLGEWFTRTGANSTFMTYNAGMEVAAANVPRIDTHAATGESLGCLIEEQTTNYLLQSGDIAASPWATNGAATFAVGDAALIAGQTFDVMTNTNGTADRRQSAVIPANRPICCSVFVKKSTNPVAAFQIHIAGSAATQVGEVILKWSDMTVTTSSQGGSTIAVVSAGVEDYGGGIYRLWMAIFPNNGNTTAYLLLDKPVATGVAGAKNQYWGAQMEVWDHPSTYIPTTTAASFRTSDLFILGTSGWFRRGAGTVLIEHRNLYPKREGRGLMAINQNGDDANTIQIYETNDGNMSANIIESGVARAGASINTTLGNRRTVLSWDPSSMTLGCNGVLVTVPVVGPIPLNTQFRIGHRSNGAYVYNEHISRVAYWPFKATEDQVRELTL